MQRPCAYCKENGHHIRNCALLAAKNSRAGKPLAVQVPKCVAQKPKSKNMYANLFDSSSDDEVEEGEIVEDRPKPAVVSDSDDDSYCEPTPQTNSNSWTRSGIKVVVIPQQVKPQVVVREPEDKNPEIDYEALAASMAEISAYFAKFRGRSWADIEYDSDLDRE